MQGNCGLVGQATGITVRAFTSIRDYTVYACYIFNYICCMPHIYLTDYVVPIQWLLVTRWRAAIDLHLNALVLDRGQTNMRRYN
jgi:hypothetical protein